jgi:hypothetical protein
LGKKIPPARILPWASADHGAIYKGGSRARSGGDHLKKGRAGRGTHRWARPGGAASWRGCGLVGFVRRTRSRAELGAADWGERAAVMNTATDTWAWKGCGFKGKQATGWVNGPAPVRKDLDSEN